MKEFRLADDELIQLRTIFKPGIRVRLEQMEDSYREMPQGLLGTVRYVDDIGTIHVDWDNGSSLGVVFGEDSCVPI